MKAPKSRFAWKMAWGRQWRGNDADDCTAIIVNNHVAPDQWRDKPDFLSDRLLAIASDAETGPITWSPDSRALAYVQSASYCPLSGKSYVVRADLPELEQTLLLESEMPTFGSAKWDVSHELRLFDENGKEWRYNLRTQELNPMP